VKKTRQNKNPETTIQSFGSDSIRTDNALMSEMVTHSLAVAIAMVLANGRVTDYEYLRLV
jgi:hypothetical protein